MPERNKLKKLKNSIVKQILSYLGIGLGTIGILLCLAIINNPIKYLLLFQVFPPIEAALSFGNTQTTALDDFVVDVQTQFTQITDAKPEATALEDEIEQITVYIDITYAVTDFAEQALTGVEVAAQSSRAENIIFIMITRLTAVLDALNKQINALEEQLAVFKAHIKQND